MLSQDFQYYINYTTEQINDCKNKGCDEEGICRCSVIVSTKIIRFDINAISNQLISEFDCVFKKYAADRVVRKLIRHSDCFNISVSGGYYGEEISSILLQDTVQKEIRAHFDIIKKLKSNIKLVQYALEVEYGYVLPQLLELKSAKIITIDKNLIILPNKKHYDNLSSIYVDQYKNYKLPRCIVKKVNDTYKLIDGNHRHKASNSKRIEVILIS